MKTNFAWKDTSGKKIVVSKKVARGEDAARNGWPLYANPWIGDIAKRWRADWITTHKTLCDGCSECKNVRHLKFKSVSMPNIKLRRRKAKIQYESLT